MNIWIRLKGKEIYAGSLIPWDAPEQDPKQRYRSFRDRSIDLTKEPTP